MCGTIDHMKNRAPLMKTVSICTHLLKDKSSISTISLNPLGAAAFVLHIPQCSAIVYIVSRLSLSKTPFNDILNSPFMADTLGGPNALCIFFSSVSEKLQMLYLLVSRRA